MRRTRRLGCLLASVLLVVANSLPSTAQELPADLPPVRTLFGNVDKATCGPGSVPETGLQGQVPLPLREAGFTGFRCNLELLSQYTGEGASWVGSWWGNCFYMSTASNAKAERPGVAVVDVTYPTDARYVKSLTTPGMLDTWESLKSANGLLAGTQQTRFGGQWFDVYDVSEDCANPVLKASANLGPLASGHEGAFAPDGRTYYSTPLQSPDPYIAFIAIDTSEPERPSVITMWHLPVEQPRARLHGLGISRDGTIGYLIMIGETGEPGTSNNGLMIVDLSQIQARVPDPQVGVIGVLPWRDNNLGQTAQEFFMGGRTYVIAVDEGGAGSYEPNPDVSAGGGGVYIRGTRWPKACDGNPPFAYGRIIDVTYPRVPTEVSRLRTEVQDPANCPKIIGDNPVGSIFGYNAHYCSVDNPDNATAIACGYFEQGIRVFDIRDPYSPKEIAYYNPPASPANSELAQKGSHARSLPDRQARADWASSAVRFYHREADDTWELWTQTQQNGLQVLKFTNGVYPLP